ncbi:MAG: phytanoyl-CoA dioxygenase family protein, partial [Proteobacteria bacterium]|nr:phytanoyl-CoA dioxygenase family protein [Pseudomonadota bacterium]
MSKIPTYTAPADGKLTAEMVADFRDSGVLIVEGFVSTERCRKLRQHTLDLIDAFDPSDVKHVFSAMEQSQLGDRYFEESGDKIRFFFEHDAFDDDGNLTQSKEDSLNKMGHAMHDL